MQSVAYPPCIEEGAGFKIIQAALEALRAGQREDVFLGEWGSVSEDNRTYLRASDSLQVIEKGDAVFFQPTDCHLLEGLRAKCVPVVGDPELVGHFHFLDEFFLSDDRIH